MKKLIYSGILLIYAVLSFNSCSSDNNEPKHVIPADKLPKIQSFDWFDHFYGGAQVIDGLNEFTYDSKERVAKWSTDDQVSTYVYTDDFKASGKSVDATSNSLLQDQSFTFNDVWLPLTQTSSDDEGNSQVSSYKYDSKGRLEHYNFTISDGRRRTIKLIYDSKTGLLAELEYSKVSKPGEDDTPVLYTFEYYDRANPVAFYPENNIFIDAEASLAIPGLDGYSRDKLIKSITFPWKLDNGEYMRYNFNYRFDSDDDKLTAVTMSVSLLDAKGKVTKEVPFADFLNIKY